MSSLKKINQGLLRATLRILDAYISAFSLPTNRSFVRRAFKRLGVENDVSIEERIGKIDVAKAALTDAMIAVDEVRDTAETKKKQAKEALQRLDELEKNRANADAEYSEIKKLVSDDAGAFRKLGGIPDTHDVRKERYIGFLSGIVASTIA